MQLVLINNRVITHGDNFITIGGVVINTETGEKYERATLAECDGCPSDIDTVGYEYHAGTFVPCAPFGVGDGNVVVACHKDCKSIKDSGVPFGRMAQIVETSYSGSGADLVSLTFDAVPKMLFIRGTDGSDNDSGYVLKGMYFRNGDFHTCDEESNPDRDYVEVKGTTITIHAGRNSSNLFNKSYFVYQVTAILQGGE